jgi:hypothetical protein
VASRLLEVPFVDGAVLICAINAFSKRCIRLCNIHGIEIVLTFRMNIFYRFTEIVIDCVIEFNAFCTLE